jgi:hypothetical protein
VEPVGYLLSRQSVKYSVIEDCIRSPGCSFYVRTGVVVDGCVGGLEVVDLRRSCGGGCFHTYGSDSTEVGSVHTVW